MKKGTLARLEIYASLAVVALLLAMAGYGLVSAFSDRLDPAVRACIDHATRNAAASGRPMSRRDAVALCKHLDSLGTLH